MMMINMIMIIIQQCPPTAIKWARSSPAAANNAQVRILMISVIMILMILIIKMITVILMMMISGDNVSDDGDDDVQGAHQAW